MAPKVPRLLWDEPLRALNALSSLWSATGLQSVTAGAAQAAVVVPYKTVFTTLQQLLIGKRVTVRMGDRDVMLTVTELDAELEPRALAVGQLGEVRVAACDIEWDQHRLQRAVAVLHNVHIRPGVPPMVVAAPAELTSALPSATFDDVLHQAVPQVRAQLCEDGSARLRWARRPDWGSLEVDAEVVGSTLWLRPRALRRGHRRWKLPARTPARPVQLPDLPHGLMVTGVSLASDSLQLKALLPEWRMELPLKYLEDLISRVSQGVLSFAWPPLFGSSD